MARMMGRNTKAGFGGFRDEHEEHRPYGRAGEKRSWQRGLSNDALVSRQAPKSHESMSLAELLGAAAVTALDDLIAEMGMTDEVAALGEEAE